jgi:hypothetical protein
MMSVSEGVKVYLFAEPVDMRKGFNGLSTSPERSVMRLD